MAVPTHTVCVLSLFLWILSQLAVVEGSWDTCTVTYRDKETNVFLTKYKTCTWGCCANEFDRTACCDSPVAVLVGGVIGGCFSLLVLIMIVCCCCCRRGHRSHRRVLMHPGQSASLHQGALLPAISTPATPGVYQPQPYYEEVMMGQVNPAFQPYADQSWV